MKPAKDPSFLAALPGGLFAALTALAQRTEIAAGEPLFQAGDEGRGCYFVQSGSLKAMLVTGGGRERMLAVFGPGSIVGEMALFDEGPRSAAVVAIKPSRLAYVSRDVFFRFADAHPDVYRHALRVLAQRLRGTNADAMAQNSATVPVRVARALLSLCEALEAEAAGQQGLIAQKVTQYDIAAMAGVARENASRIMNKWMKDGTLLRKDGRYIVKDLAFLQELTENSE